MLFTANITRWVFIVAIFKQLILLSYLQNNITIHKKCISHLINRSQLIRKGLIKRNCIIILSTIDIANCIMNHQSIKCTLKIEKMSINSSKIIYIENNMNQIYSMTKPQNQQNFPHTKHPIGKPIQQYFNDDNNTIKNQKRPSLHQHLIHLL